MSADGYIRNGKYISIGQSGDDGLNKIKFIKSMICPTAVIRTIRTSGQNSYAINFTSREIVTRLAHFGIVQAKSLKLMFPYQIYGMSDIIKSSYLCGLIEGDGSIGTFSTVSGRYLYVQVVGTTALMDGVSKLVPVAHVRTTIKRSSDCSEIRWNGTRAASMFKWIYQSSDVYRGRKYLNGASYLGLI